MSSNKRKRAVSAIRLEQYLLGELSRSEMSQLKRILDEDEESQDRLIALEQSNKEILEQYPVDEISRRIQLKLDHQTSRFSLRSVFRPWRLTALAGAAAAMILLMIILPANFPTSERFEGISTERIKGQEPHLKLYRKTQDGSEELINGSLAYQGDIIRIGYQAGGDTYGIILSVDGRGEVTLYLPRQGTRSVLLKKDGIVLLDSALELDDAPHWERFYFVTGNSPFEADPILRAARQIDIKKSVDRLERLNVSKHLKQFIFFLEKGDRR